jgi:serine/threonine protein kinase
MARSLAGRYELEVPLGRGASGEVWRGRDLATRKPVAVKLVELARIEDSALVAETIARFRREAATLARLRHPNIVAALEAGRINNELFLVMELAGGTGPQLHRRHQRRCWPGPPGAGGGPANGGGR